MTKLSEALQKKINDLIDLAKAENSKGEVKATMKYLNQALDVLPEPKGLYEEGYSIVKYIIQVCLKSNQLDEAESWALKLYDYGAKTHDGGEKEYLHGRVEFAMKNMDKASKLFKTAFEKSEGRFPPQKDAEYIKLLL